MRKAIFKICLNVVLASVTVSSASAQSTSAALVATGFVHACASTATGSVKCWGSNHYGALGDGTHKDRLTPVFVTGLDNVNGLAAALDFTCALIQTGAVKCWGSHQYGTTPVDVAGLSNATAITAGVGHSCAVTGAGGVECWGRNRYGQLGNGTTTPTYTPTDVIGLTSGVRSIAAGNSHTCAVLTGGGVKCWGYNQLGNLGDGTTTDRWTPVSVVGLSDVVAVAGGLRHTCALTAGGGVKCWGFNWFGQLGDGTRIDKHTPADVVGLAGGVKAIAAAEDYTCALLNEGGVKCWGYNGSILGTGSPREYLTLPTDVRGLSVGAVSLAAGQVFRCVITIVGDIKCWGYDQSSQLGDGTSASFRATPIDVIGFK